MKISLDAGAFCGGRDSHFGNYVFTKNIIEALALYDKKNQYFAYSFCRKPKGIPTYSNIIYQKLLPTFSWMRLRVSIDEFFTKKDVFLALNQSLPIYTKAKKIVFSHGLSFHFFPQYYPDSCEILKKQFGEMVKRADWLVVSSKKVKEEITSAGRISEDKVIVIPYGVPFDMLDRAKLREKGKSNYFLYVGMNHPIKNIKFMIDSFRLFRQKKEFSHFKLIMVTDRLLKNYPGNNIFIYKYVSRQRLAKLYQEATAYLTSSFYESFNFPIVEALVNNCPVIALKSAVIPELKKYVMMVSDMEEFVDQMKKVVKDKNGKINNDEIVKTFSWSNYVNKLTHLYD